MDPIWSLNISTWLIKKINYILDRLYFINLVAVSGGNWVVDLVNYYLTY